MLAVLDALHALRWAFILVEFGPEHEVHQLFDVFMQRARQRPSHLENFRAYYESASWQLCTALRAGKTFAEAAAQVKMDTHLYQDIMARDTPKKPQDTKRKVQDEDKRKDGKGTGKDPNSPAHGLGQVGQAELGSLQVVVLPEVGIPTQVGIRVPRTEVAIGVSRPQQSGHCNFGINTCGHQLWGRSRGKAEDICASQAATIPASAAGMGSASAALRRIGMQAQHTWS